MTEAGGPDFVSHALRIAVFDNDGMLWCEQPILERLTYLRVHGFKTYIVSRPTGRLDKGLDDAEKHGWRGVDMNSDWTKVFPGSR